MTFDNVNVSPSMERLQKAFQGQMNQALAQMLREALRLHEASWDPHIGPLMMGGYTRHVRECIREVVGDNPIAKIMDCLFTAGYTEMWEFCNEVLGPQVEEK